MARKCDRCKRGDRDADNPVDVSSVEIFMEVDRDSDTNESLWMGDLCSDCIKKATDAADPLSLGQTIANYCQDGTDGE